MCNDNYEFDYLVVGAGLFGSVFAYEAKKLGYKCLVIDKRNHLAGNIYTEQIESINVHKYGPHVFHTDDEVLWNYFNRFANFNNFRYSPLANYKGKLYNLPFNMNTFYQIWGEKEPEKIKKIINDEIQKFGFDNPKNLEETALSLVGKTVYEILIKGYTEKQWGRKASEIPSFIVKRLPLRFTFDNNYFNHKFQGIPIGGYNQIVEKMLEGLKVLLNTDYLKNSNYLNGLAKKIVYSGPLDEMFHFRYGRLEYRSLEFNTLKLNIDNYQGVAGVNYTSSDVPYTRIIEHKHFEFGKQPNTIITEEYSREWRIGDEPYYPINSELNNQRYKRYKKLADEIPNLIIGGRLADYKYYDMHNVVRRSLDVVKQEFGKNSCD